MKKKLFAIMALLSAAAITQASSKNAYNPGQGQSTRSGMPDTRIYMNGSSSAMQDSERITILNDAVEASQERRPARKKRPANWNLTHRNKRPVRHKRVEAQGLRKKSTGSASAQTKSQSASSGSTHARRKRHTVVAQGLVRAQSRASNMLDTAKYYLKKGAHEAKQGLDRAGRFVEKEFDKALSFFGGSKKHKERAQKNLQKAHDNVKKVQEQATKQAQQTTQQLQKATQKLIVAHKEASSK